MKSNNEAFYYGQAGIEGFELLYLIAVDVTVKLNYPDSKGVAKFSNLGSVVEVSNEHAIHRRVQTSDKFCRRLLAQVFLVNGEPQWEP